MTPRISDAKLQWPGAARKIVVDCVRYSREQYARVRAGHIGESMDDKWALLWEGDRLAVCRSWTGAVVFDCRFEEDSGGWALREIAVDDVVPARHELEDVGAAWFLIGWLLLGELSWKDVDQIAAQKLAPEVSTLFRNWAELLRRRVAPSAGPLPTLPATATESLAYFRALRARHPDSVGILRRLAELHEALGDWEGAERACTEAAAAWKSFGPIFARAWVRRAKGDLRGAADDFQEALRRCAEPDDVRDFVSALKVRRAEEFRLDLHEELAPLQRELDAENLTRSPRPVARGLLRLAIGDWDGAVEELSGDPKDGLALKFRAFARLQKNDPAGALRDAEDALTRLPMDDFALFVRKRARSGL
jgi:tetratricopeptide (TPR) repeat protein